MGQAVGQVLSFGAGVALSPVPIIAVVLMLATPRGRVNGPAFLGGWLVGLAVVGTVVLLAASGGGASSAGEPATWVSWLKSRSARCCCSLPSSNGGAGPGRAPRPTYR